MEKDGSAFG